MRKITLKKSYPLVLTIVRVHSTKLLFLANDVDCTSVKLTIHIYWLRNWNFSLKTALRCTLQEGY